MRFFRFLACSFLALLISTRLTVFGDTIHWRQPGVSGRWDDPTNWKRFSDGAAVVPTSSDDVVIGGKDFSSFRPWPPASDLTWTVYAKSNVDILSLTINEGCDCSPGQDGFQWVYDSGSGLWQFTDTTGGDVPACSQTLHFSAPSSLNAVGRVYVRRFGGLLMTGSVDSPWEVPSISASSMRIDGAVVGSANIHVESKVEIQGGSAQIITLQSDGFPAPYANGGIWNIYGDFLMNSGEFRYWNNGNEIGNYSRLIVSNTNGTNTTNGTALLTMNLVNRDFRVYIQMQEWRGNTFYVNSNTSEAPAFFVYDDLSIQEGCDTPSCDPRREPVISSTSSPNAPLFTPDVRTQCNDPFNPPSEGDGGCTKETNHDVSLLLSTASACSGSSGLDCPGEPDCNDNGVCTDDGGGSGVCACASGWRGYACEVEDCPGIPDCSGRGTCVSLLPGVAPTCVCDVGWGGPDGDCAIPQCPTDSNGAVCSGNGECNIVESPPRCVCGAGYAPGTDGACSLAVSACAADINGTQCSGHGTCATNNTCQCDTLWTGQNCGIPVCPIGSNGIQCSAHGKCTNVNETYNECTCDAGWSNDDGACGTPLCLNDCNGRGVCVEGLSPPKCLCYPPLFRVWAVGEYSFSNGPPNASVVTPLYTGEDCSTNLPNCSASSCVSCDSDGGCDISSCPENFRGWDCSLPFCPGTGVPECSGHGSCVVSANDSSATECVCNEGWELGPNGDCSVPQCIVNNCTDHGRCRVDLAVPVCDCDPAYSGDQCESGLCPGFPIQCSGHGVCNATAGSCTCELGSNYGWTGLDCSVPLCPPSFSPDQQNCNGRGTCNTSDPFNHTCVCTDETWTGDACEISRCPNGCTNALQGVCDILGDEPQCVCNPGFSGDDCSQREGDGDGGDDRALENIWPVFLSILAIPIICLVILCAVAVSLIVSVMLIVGTAISMRKKDRLFASFERFNNAVVNYGNSSWSESQMESYQSSSDSG